MDFYYVVLPAIVALIMAVAPYFAVKRVLRLRRRGESVVRRWAEGLALLPCALICVVIAFSTAINAIALYWYRHPPPGSIYRVDGHAMRIQCMGQGSPAIVLEAGGGNDGLTWIGIQPKLAAYTQVCSYDRAGMGWSDPRRGVRDADHIAPELHELLAAAKVPTPVILMGHSMGGLIIRDYAAHYPKEVAGLVFEDSSTPLQNRDPEYRAHDRPDRFAWLNDLFNEAAIVTGIPRLLGACSGRFDRVRGITERLFYEDRCHERFQAIGAEMDAFDASGQETVNTGPFGAVPILVLSHDESLDTADGLPQSLLQVFDANQNRLLTLSTRSRRVIAKNSYHYVHIDRPDLVERELADLLHLIRGDPPGLKPWQATVLE